MQPLDRFAPAPAIDQVVPVWNYISERTALVAKGDAAVHAACALLPECLFGHLEFIFAPVLDALAHCPPRRRLALDLHEARNLTHCNPISSLTTPLPYRG